MKKLLSGLMLLIIAIIIAVVLIPIVMPATVAFIFIKYGFKKACKEVGLYFEIIALSIDQMGNVIFQRGLNAWFINERGYQFGNMQETMSSVLGRNQLKGTLKIAGKILVSILDKIEPNHCIKNIERNMYFFKTIK